MRKLKKQKRTKIVSFSLAVLVMFCVVAVIVMNRQNVLEANAATEYPEALLSELRDAVVARRTDEIDISQYQVDSEEAFDLIRAVKQAYPIDCYAAPEWYLYTKKTQGGKLQTLTFTMSACDESHETRVAKLRNVVDPVLKNLQGKSAFSKVILVHDTLIRNGSYDNSLKNTTAYALLVDGTGTCTSYTDAFQMYMDLLDVPCISVDGKMNGGGHAWNMVCINGNWYHVDVTSDDPVSGSGTTYTDNHSISWRLNLLLNTQEISKTHSNISANAMPSESEAYSDMPRNGSLSQYFYGDKWYVKSDDGDKITQYDQYGKNERILVNTTINGFTGYQDVVIYGSGDTLYAYWTQTGYTGVAVSISEEEANTLDHPAAATIYAAWTDNDGNLMYSFGDKRQYYSWSNIQKSARIIDFGHTWRTIKSIYAQLDALPDTVSNDNEAIKATEMMQTYATLTDDGRTNIDTEHSAKIESIRSSLGQFARVPANGLTLTTNSRLHVGESEVLSAVVTPPNSTDVPTWTTSDALVVTVDSTGKITAVGEGQAIITATAGDYSAQCTVESVDEGISVTLSTYNIWMYRGNTYQLTATVVPNNRTGDVVWKSNDEAIVTVENGLLTGIAPGKTTVTASVDNIVAECEVRVDIKATSVSVGQQNVYLKVGDVYTLQKIILPSDATEDWYWETSSLTTDIISVTKQGVVTALKPGTTSVRLRSGLLFDTCKIIVDNDTVPATSVELRTKELCLEPQKSKTMSYSVQPSNCTNSKIWTSSDESVVTVTASGYVRTVAPGQATITLTVGDYSDSCIVTVTDDVIHATKITAPRKMTLEVGQQSPMSAVMEPDNATDTISYYSSDLSIATVSVDGNITAVAPGTVTITATVGRVKATCEVTVTNPITAINLSQATLSLKKYDNSTLTATVTPNYSSDIVVWTSSNTAVATVSNGVVTAVGKGSATITAKAGRKSATCEVTVTNPSTSIMLSQTSLNIKKGENAALTATVTPDDSSDGVVWTSSNTVVATVSNGVVTAVGKGSATITAKAGSNSATCAVTVTEATPTTTYDVTPNINGGASKLYEPWGLRYYAVFTGADIDKISDRGIAILKATYYTSGMTPAQFCANENANIFLSSRNELAFEAATSSNPNGRYFATLTKGIYSYDIGAKYYVVPFAIMNNGQTIYGTIKNNSMENILKANLNLSTITANEKAICTCILELKKSVAAHYEAAGVPGASVDMNIPRGSSQSAASVKTTTESGITPNVVSGASRLIEPWGLRYFATYTDSANIAQRGMVILSEKYYQSSYSSSPDKMRLNANAYVFRDSDGTLLKENDTNRFYGTVTEGISSKDIADVYYVVPFAVLNDGSYVYGTVKSNSMMKIMKSNLNSSSVPATERAVSEDIIDLYNAVKAYYDEQ